MTCHLALTLRDGCLTEPTVEEGGGLQLAIDFRNYVSLRFFSLKRMSPCLIKFSHSKTPQITRYFRNTTYLIIKHNYSILVEKVHETSSAQRSL